MKNGGIFHSCANKGWERERERRRRTQIVLHIEYGYRWERQRMLALRVRLDNREKNHARTWSVAKTSSRQKINGIQTVNSD